MEYNSHWSKAGPNQLPKTLPRYRAITSSFQVDKSVLVTLNPVLIFEVSQVISKRFLLQGRFPTADLNHVQTRWAHNPRAVSGVRDRLPSWSEFLR